LLEIDNPDSLAEQEPASLFDQPDSISLFTIVEKQVEQLASLSAECSETQIFRTWRHKKNQEAGGT